MALVKLPLPQDQASSTFLGLIDATSLSWNVWRGRNPSSFTIGGTATPVADLGTVLVGGAASGATHDEIAGLADSTDAIAPLSTQSALRAAGLLYGYDGTNWRRLQTDASENLKVAVNAALPAGSNLIGGVNASQVGGVAVPNPPLTGVPLLPVGAQGVAAYAVASLAFTSGNANAYGQINFPNNTIAATGVIDAREAVVVIVNAGTGTTITAAGLSTSDSAGGVSYLATYGLVNVSVPNNSYQVCKVALSQGTFASWYLDFSTSAAPTTGTVYARLLLRSHATAGGDIFSGTVNPSTSAAALARSPSDPWTGAKLPCRSVFVQNDPTSNGDVYVGAGNQQTERLTAGAGLGLEVNDVSKVYVAAVSGSPRVNWHAEV